MDIINKKDSFLFPYKGGYRISLFKELIAISSDKPYVCLIFEQEKVLVRASLLTFRQQIQDYFIQVNRQLIVNMYYVSEFILINGSYWILLRNGARYKVSERRERVVKTAFLFYNK